MPKPASKNMPKLSKPNLNSGAKVEVIRRALIKAGFRRLTPAEMAKSELVASLS